MKSPEFIELFAGIRPDGQKVVEKLLVSVQEDNSCLLLKSPAFIHGLASGDLIKLNEKEQTFELLKRSGNLCIRIYAKEDVEAIASDLGPLIEKIGGELDIENERMLVYSIHVSCGFKNIEDILNDHIGEETDSAWFYGNVYDPQDGVTPLNWWKEILKPE